MSKLQAFGPSGSPIVGSVETVKVIAYLDGLFRGEKGKPDYKYAGESEVEWDTQEPTGSYVDADDNTWALGQLVWKPAKEEEQE